MKDDAEINDSFCNEDAQEIIRIAIDGELDLHNFSPKALKTLLPDYLEECLKANIYEVRIVHGKGTGTLRRSVHAILQRSLLVKDFKLADMHSGSWGATIVTLNRPQEP